MLVRVPVIALALLKKHKAFPALEDVGLSISILPKDTQQKVFGIDLKDECVAMPLEFSETAHVSFGDQALREKKKKGKQPSLAWEAKFALLRAFKKLHGHCRVPPRYVVGGVKLGGWVATQRKEYIKHRFGCFSAIINDKRVARLEKVGFEWDLASNGLGSLAL